MKILKYSKMLCCFEFKNAYFTVILHICCLFALLLFYFEAASNFVFLPALILSTFYTIISSYLHFKLNNGSYIFCSNMYAAILAETNGKFHSFVV